MQSADEKLNETADYLAATLERTDPRAWRKLLIYCPNWLVLERAKMIKEPQER